MASATFPRRYTLTDGESTLIQRQLRVREIDVALSGQSPSHPAVRIAHISDFHFRKWNPLLDEARDVLAKGGFDFVAATGDFGTEPTEWEHTASMIERFFGPIVEHTPVFAVLGNHDHAALPDHVDLPIRFLRNESTVWERDEHALEIVGLDQTEEIPRGLPENLLSPVKTRSTVLLAHFPSTIYQLPGQRVDLQLSGHTHGGQIRFPFVGCIWSNDRIPARMARGLHRVNDCWLHVNPGIGVSPPIPWRFNCPPEITVLRLSTTQTADKNNLQEPHMAQTVT